MSASLLYHAFGVRGYRYVRSDYQLGETVFTIDQADERLRCAACGSRRVIRRGKSERRLFKTVPIGWRPTWVLFAIPRLGCQDCGVVRQAEVGFADPRCHYTRALERYVLDLLRSMTIQDAADLVELSWDTVKDIQKRHLRRQFSSPRLRDLKYIAIDELAIGKGHRYVTVVMDLKSQRVVHVGDGKGGDALRPFWKRLRASGAKPKAVATDLSAAYLQAVLTHLRGVKHVADRFHVIKLMNERLSEFRRNLYREWSNVLQRKVLKGTRWLLLKNPDHLDEKKDERRRLEEALTMNQPLATAYYLKEDLRQIWSQPDKQTARRVLDDWIRRASVTGTKPLQQMANTLASVRSSILNHYDFPISTGPLETMNNKIQLLRRKAYGYRDQEFFKLKILALHNTKYALVG